MKRRIARSLVLLLTVTILFLYPLLASTAHRIDHAHFDQIKDGMTEAEVEGIFGVPAGEYDWAVATGPDGIWFDLSINGQGWGSWPTTTWSGNRIHYRILAVNGELLPAGGSWHSPSGLGHMKTWAGRHGAFFVTFDDRGRVVMRGSAEIRTELPWARWWRSFTAK